MIPYVEFRFSLRMPPTLNSDQAVKDMTELLTTNVPYGAKVMNNNIIGINKKLSSIKRVECSNI